MAKNNKHTGTPKFPYTTSPSILRKILKAIPSKPKPDRLTSSTVVSWNAASNTGGNTTTAVGVLKKLALIDPGGMPTPLYVEFMNGVSGAAALGRQIREVYKPLFNSSHDPAREPDADLRNLFNVHSGGGEDAMRLQIQTFKALSEFATFNGEGTPPGGGKTGGPDLHKQTGSGTGANSTLPPIQVDLHIHLPENKSTRDYEAIIQDIAKYIYGRNIDQT